MCKNRCVNRDELSEAGADAGGRKRERRRAAAATKAVHRRQRAAAIERLQRAAQRRGQRRQATVITGVKRDKLGASGGAVERTHMCNKTWRCRVNSGLMIVRPGGSQGHDFGNQSSSWVAQLLSQLLHNESRGVPQLLERQAMGARLPAEAAGRHTPAIGVTPATRRGCAVEARHRAKRQGLRSPSSGRDAMGESNHAKQFFCSFYCDSFTRDYDKCAEIDVDPQPATAFCRPPARGVLPFRVRRQGEACKTP